MNPYRHIVAGTDFSEASSAAVNAAARIAKLTGGTLTLLHIIPPAAYTIYTPAMFPGTITALETEAREHGASLLRKLAETLSDQTDVKTEVSLARSVGLGIVEAASASAADLIVVGTHGFSGLTRLLIGSVATKVLRHAECDVLTVPPEFEMFTSAATVLAATDLSRPADLALRRAAWWAEVTNSELRVVHAFDDSVPVPAAESGLSTIDALRGQLRERTRQVVGTELGDVVAGRSAVDALCRYADEHDARLIVAARHGRGAIERLLIGSVTERLARHAKRPLLCVDTRSSETP
jgi:nucleotide-binding universal stress UspA family protein